MPVRILKIDRSFVLQMLDNRDDRAIVDGVIGLGKAFGRQVIAEGVESVEHGLELRRLGCDMAQGFGIARPMPADRVRDWIAQWSMPPEWGVV
jgi:EAL domain-containing protein (putative c-di-GMP-specific phosphodiesterase class I)